MQLGKAPNRLYIYGRLGSQAPQGPGHPARRAGDKLSRLRLVGHTVQILKFQVLLQRVAGRTVNCTKGCEICRLSAETVTYDMLSI